MAERVRQNQDGSGGVLRIRDARQPGDDERLISLDDLDRDIIEMHQKDLTFSYAQLAAKWGVTVATIRNRIKRLKAAGVMEIILVLNPKKVGFDTFVVIGVRLAPGTDMDTAIKRIGDQADHVGPRRDQRHHGCGQIRSFCPLFLSRHRGLQAARRKQASEDPRDSERRGFYWDRLLWSQVRGRREWMSVSTALIARGRQPAQG